jgi:hypothetical protein
MRTNAGDVRVVEGSVVRREGAEQLARIRATAVSAANFIISIIGVRPI